MSDRPRDRSKWTPKDGDYAYLDTLSEHDYGWEFLRRNSEYEQDALRAGADRVKPQVLPTGQKLWRQPASMRASSKWGLCPFREPGAEGAGCPLLVDGACRWCSA